VRHQLSEIRFGTFLALGDSFTEGLWDRHPDGSLRGWADRVAEGISLAQSPNPLHYANLAVRGKLLPQVESQVALATGLLGTGDLVTFHAGANDALRPGFDIGNFEVMYSDALSSLSDTGATVVVFTVIERAGGSGKTAQRLADRFSAFNEVVRRVADKYGALVVPASEVAALQDRRFWHADRLHLNAQGHERVAAAVLEILGFQGEYQWRSPLPRITPRPKVHDFLVDLHWFARYALPWIWRRVRGISSGDGRVSKHDHPRLWE
jgi:lysophospholipase L1-like esterase